MLPNKTEQISLAAAIFLRKLVALYENSGTLRGEIFLAHAVMQNCISKYNEEDYTSSVLQFPECESFTRAKDLGKRVIG